MSMESSTSSQIESIKLIDVLLRSPPSDNLSLLQCVANIALMAASPDKICCNEVKINGDVINIHPCFTTTDHGNEIINSSDITKRLSELNENFFAQLFCTDAFIVKIPSDCQPFTNKPIGDKTLLIQFAIRFSAEHYGLFHLFIRSENKIRDSLSILSLLSSTATSILHTANQDNFGQPYSAIKANKQFDRRLLDILNQGVFIISQEGTIVSANRAAERAFEAEPTSLKDKDISSIFPEFNHYKNAKELDSNDSFLAENGCHGLTVSNSPVSFDLAMTQQQDDDKQVFILYITQPQQNITDEFIENQFKAITNLAPVGILHVDQKLNTLFVNQKFSALCGYSTDHLLNRNWLAIIHKDDLSCLLAELRLATSRMASFQTDIRVKTKQEETIWTQLCGQPIVSKQQKMSGLLVTIADITQNLKTQQKLQNLAEKDSLTGLYNRAYFQSRLNQALDSTERRGKIAVFYIDLDDFKKINDTKGHQVGDTLLAAFAKRFKSLVRREDTVSRIGGDEFTLIIEQAVDPSKILHLAEVILDKIASPFYIIGNEIFLSISIGICMGDAKTHTADSILNQADAALYRAKSLGKNRCQIFTNKLDEETKKKLKVTRRLSHALEKNEFSILYQPIFSKETQAIVSFECLLRWTPSPSAEYPPSFFVPLLEDSGEIYKVGIWVIQEVCAKLKEWIHTKIVSDRTSISINISYGQLRNNNFASDVKNILVLNKLSPANIILEIKEGIFSHDHAYELKSLEQLKALGINISLDNFGTGDSSVTQLATMPMDEVKTSKSLIDNLAKDDKSRSFTESVISLSKNLELDVTATCIDSHEKLDAAIHTKCDRIQGNILCPAISGIEVKKYAQRAAGQKTNIVQFPPSST